MRKHVQFILGAQEMCARMAYLGINVRRNIVSFAQVTNQQSFTDARQIFPIEREKKI